MMASVSKQSGARPGAPRCGASIASSAPHPSPRPSTPRQAVRRRGAVDARLDPALFKALSDPTRVRLLACLIKCDRACSVSEVAACCSVDFSVVARHLGLLARSGLLDARKEGRTMWYSARSAELAGSLRALADAIEEWCCGNGEDEGGGCCASDCCGGTGS
ncbi:MAG: ArsR/SmtB family transcription factor [Phycisphaerales bacterium]